MKTRTISRCAAVLLALAAFLCGCTGGGTSSAGETPPAESRVESPAPAASESASSAAPVSSAIPWQAVSGTVLEESDGVLTLFCTDDARFYRFSTGSAQIGAKPGDTADVIYTGELDPALPLQDAQVRSVEPTGKSAAQRVLDTMTLAEKVGQLFLARCPGEDAAALAKQYHVGGYVLFGQDFADETPASAAAKIQSYQDVSEVPLWIAVDEEGGTVNRVSRYPAFRSTPFPSPQAVYASGGFDAIREDTQEKCALLKPLGINLNLAPVCDVTENPDAFMYARAFGQDAAATSTYVETVVSQMRAQGMACALKHFPGYGDNADTHTGVAEDTRPKETFETSDFLPFSAGIAAGADFVLVAHTVVDCMDAEKPASLSPEVHRVLREELGFAGILLTDDLSMEGLRAFADDGEAAVEAVKAGNDLLCCTNFTQQIPAVLDAVEDGTLSEDRIDASVLRLLQVKEAFGLLPAP